MGNCFYPFLIFYVLANFQEQQQGGCTDEAEPFMGSGRFGNYLNWPVFDAFNDLTVYASDFCDSMAARAYLLGYNCDDEKELEAALKFCWSKCFIVKL